MGNFQEKSTRYIHFGKESLLFSDQVKNSKYGKEIVDVCNRLIETDETFTPIIKQVLIDNGVLKREDFTSERVFDNTLSAKVFDIMRYVLPVNVCTSLGASFATRTLEVHLSYMLSHPLEEIRILAKSMHEEALKLSPGLLKHVEENAYEVARRKKVDEEVAKLIHDKSYENNVYKGIDRKERFTIISN